MTPKLNFNLFKAIYMKASSLSTLLIIMFAFSLNNRLSANGLSTFSFSETNQMLQIGDDDFIGSFTMSVTEFKKGKPSKDSPIKIDYYFQDNQIAFAPEATKGQQTILIYNVSDRMMTTLINKDGEKTGMKMKMPKIKIDGKVKDNMEYSIKATEERKTIEGYSCRKYLIESEENSGYAWITEDVNIDYERIANLLNIDQKNSHASGLTLKDLKGFAMETYTKSKKKDEAYEMKVTNLSIGKLEKNIFDTSDYNMTDMSSLMNFGGE